MNRFESVDSMKERITRHELARDSAVNQLALMFAQELPSKGFGGMSESRGKEFLHNVLLLAHMANEAAQEIKTLKVKIEETKAQTAESLKNAAKEAFGEKAFKKQQDDAQQALKDPEWIEWYRQKMMEMTTSPLSDEAIGRAILGMAGINGLRNYPGGVRVVSDPNEII